MNTNVEIYICTKNSTFISQPFNIWVYRKEYFTNALEEVLNDVVVDFIYRLIKAKKFRKNEIIDIYFNTVNIDTGEVEPLLSYTEYHSRFPDININPCAYGAQYKSLFDLLLDHPDKDNIVHRKCMHKNEDVFCEPNFRKPDTVFECRVFPDRDMYLRYFGNNTNMIVIGTGLLDSSCVDYINQINEFIKGLPS
ncbi:hypothetical protein [Methanobrevibacter sp.]|uniref:hypothetical protein n=1 Tax=Methanobrevibacter sp. TaxID=66852 RepID=UPI00388DACD7